METKHLNNRTVKFRGKAKDTIIGWVYGDLAHFLDGFTVDQTSVDPASVGQFTGLRDREGKEIWEGDIFDWYDPETESPTRPLCGARCVVFYDEETARFKYRAKSNSGEGFYTNDFDRLDGRNYIVVTGNIIDNPD